MEFHFIERLYMSKIVRKSALRHKFHYRKYDFAGEKHSSDTFYGLNGYYSDASQ